MNKIRFVFLAFILMLAGTSSAYARDSFGFSINLGGPVYYPAPPVVYYSPPPAVYYSPAPVYYHYYGPSVYYRSYEPRRYYHDRGNHGGWDRGWNNHDRGNHGWDGHRGGRH